jgi:hypothetical protein
MKKKITSSKSIKKYKPGGENETPPGDTTKLNNLKKAAITAGNKLVFGDVRDFGKNLSNFASKQKAYKQEEHKGKPGYDAQGVSNLSKLKSAAAKALGINKYGGSIKSSKSKKK